MSGAKDQRVDDDEMPEIVRGDPRWKPLGRRRRGMKFTLALLRKAAGLSQEEVAERATMAQSEVSRIEQRSDRLVSTLQRYAKALGGDLHVSVEIRGRKYEIALP